MARSLDLYIVEKPSGHVALFGSHDAMAALESESTNRLRQFINWFSSRSNRFLSWMGRGIRSLYDYYLKLEDKIDPVERVLKAMASTNCFVVYGGNRHSFQRVLRRQRWKHVFWFFIDFLITAVVIVFTPVLAPIPGPNFFFYYPFLRLLSHYRSIVGTSSGLNSGDIQFKDLPELSGLEHNLPGLSSFLERMD